VGSEKQLIVNQDGQTEEVDLSSLLVKLMPKVNEHKLRTLIDLQKRFTRNGDYSIWSWWFEPVDATHDRNKYKVWNKPFVDSFINIFNTEYITSKAAHSRQKIKGMCPYRGAAQLILKALDKFEVYNKNVAVVGTEKPWIEAIALNFNNKVTTVEYNVPRLDQDVQLAYPDFKVENYFEFEKNHDKRFDCIISFSSIEHSGLGRYGEPLDPDGDIKTMAAIRNNLKDDGVVVFGAPIGRDAVFWNAQRVYGRKRLPLLFAGFKQVDYFHKPRFNLEKIIDIRSSPQTETHQPLIVLQKEL